MEVGQTGCFPAYAHYGPHPYAGLRVRRIQEEWSGCQRFVAVDDPSRIWQYDARHPPLFVDIQD